MPVFIHAADIHLDSPLLGLIQDDCSPDIDDIRGATRQALDNLVSLVISHKAPLLLIAGDLYDGEWRDFSTGLYFAAQMQRLSAVGTKVAIVRGNHDAANTMTKTLVLPDNVKVFCESKPETWILDDIGVAIHGQSYPTRDVSENLAIKYPEPLPGLYNIGLLHCFLSGAHGHRSYAPCSLDHLLEKNYDYWALGHVHQYSILHRKPVVAYSGCSQGRHIHEQGEKGCLLFDTEADAAEPEFISLDVLRWHHFEINISDAKSIEEVTETVANALTTRLEHQRIHIHCCRITLRGSCPIHGHLHMHIETLTANLRAITAQISNNRYWIEKIQLKTTPVIDLEEMATSATPQGELLRYIQNISSSTDLLSSLDIDLTPLRAKLAGSGITLELDDDLLFHARDVILTLLSDMEPGGEKG